MVSTAMYFRAEKALKREAAARAESERQAKISNIVNAYLQSGIIAKGPEATVREAMDAASKEIEDASKDLPEMLQGEHLIEASIIEASMRQMLGNMYLGIGLYKEAEPHLECALQLFRAQLGEEHLTTLSSMKDLASLYSKQGRYDKAFVEYASMVAEGGNK